MGKMRRILLFLSLLTCVPAFAQTEALRARIDSLRALADSLESLLPREAPALPPVYTQAATDSLYDLWCANLRTTDYDVPENIDSAHFTSRVSDEVLIARLKAMNPFFTLPFNETVKNYMIVYSEKRPKSMARVLGLSPYLMPVIEEAFSRYGLPLELKYMAIIESMMNPLAVSRAGAVGMWQFMYKTAKVYGLNITSFVDERKDMVKSSDAAARYLRDAYRVLGDWPLAISSYNCGMGNVQKAIRRAGSRDFWAVYPYLPTETRGYVPAFVGAYYAMTYYKDYGIVPADVGMPAQTDTFHIRKNLHFKQIEEVVGIPEDELRMLNPQYIHDIIPGSEGPCVLTLPYHRSAAFIAVHPDSLYAHRATELLSEQILKGADSPASAPAAGPKRYTVKRGESLSSIATKYGTTPAHLRKWNALKSDVLKVGQVLYVGGYAPGKAPSAATTSSAYSIYVVKAGDTLTNIAAKYPGMTARELMEYNKIGQDILVGQRIKIPKK